jgi:hypothetical protein
MVILFLERQPDTGELLLLDPEVLAGDSFESEAVVAVVLPMAA